MRIDWNSDMEEAKEYSLALQALDAEIPGELHGELLIRQEGVAKPFTMLARWIVEAEWWYVHDGSEDRPLRGTPIGWAEITQTDPHKES